MSRKPNAKPMVCCDCSTRIVATMDQARRHGWTLWVGGARCKGCGVKLAKRAGEPEQPEPAPLSPEMIADHRKALTPKIIDGALRTAEHCTRHLAIAFGMIGYEEEHREVFHMAERLWTMVKEGRR